MTPRPSSHFDAATTVAVDLFDCRLCRRAVQGRPWGGGECQHCGSVSVRALPSQEDIAAFYAKYNQSYTGGGVSQGRNLERYARRYLQIVRRWRGSGRLIDIGSSNNPFPNHAARAGFDTTVMDFAPPTGLDRGVRFVEGHLNDESALGARLGVFDIVTSWAVLEHVPDPPRSARVLAALCRPAGLIVLSTPEAGTALTRHAVGRSPWFYPPEHLNLVSPRAMESIFAAAGCRMLHWGRLELSWLRFATRYGIGAAGAVTGAFLQVASTARWQARRDNSRQRFQGVTYFVLEKSSGVAPIDR